MLSSGWFAGLANAATLELTWPLRMASTWLDCRSLARARLKQDRARAQRRDRRRTSAAPEVSQNLAPRYDTNRQQAAGRLFSARHGTGFAGSSSAQDGLGLSDDAAQHFAPPDSPPTTSTARSASRSGRHKANRCSVPASAASFASSCKLHGDSAASPHHSDGYSLLDARARAGRPC